MAADETARTRPVVGECPNPNGKPYTLWELVALLKDKTFAQFFVNLVKRAEDNDPAAIACVNSYLAPTDQELQDLDIPASDWGTMRKCTDSGLLAIAKANLNS
jgi:hypothetical protein